MDLTSNQVCTLVLVILALSREVFEQLLHFQENCMSTGQSASKVLFERNVASSKSEYQIQTREKDVMRG